MLRKFVIVGGLVLVAACSDARHDAAPAADCLAAVSGEDLAARQLRSAQQPLTAAGSTAAAWVEAGRSWVRLARLRSAPAYHRHAEACATRALAQTPGDVSARQLQALVWLDAHRFADVQTLARELLARDANDPPSWGLLSDAELELGHVPEAIAAAQQMVDRKPGLLSYGRAAHLRWLTGDRAGAKQLYQAAIAAGREQADPEPRSWLTVQAAWLFWHEGDYQGAQRGFELALSQLPDYAPALVGLGRVALSQGDARGAITWLARAQARQPLPETAWWLGDAYTLAGDPEHAKALYGEVEQLGMRFDPRTLALFLATRGAEPERALQLARLAYSQRADYQSKDVLAFALYRSGQLQEATRLAREVLALGVPDARIWRRAGLILQAAGDPSARQLLERAQALNPHGDTLGGPHAGTLAQR